MLGDKIRQGRKLRLWTQDQLAEEAGISREQVSRYESNKTVPDTRTIRKIAEALGCSTGDLLEDFADKSLNQLHERNQDLSLDERELLINYQHLTPEGKQWIRKAMEGALCIFKR